MLKRPGLPLLAIVAAAVLPACSLLPGTGPTSDAVNDNATAGVRSTASLPYALVDVSADTIGFLSQPNLITFKGEFPDKRPKPNQVVGVGDVLNISIFEAAPGGLFTPGQAAGARPGNFVDLPAQAVDQKGSIYVPYAGEIPAAARTIPGNSAGRRCPAAQPRDRAAGRHQPQSAALERRQRFGRCEYAGRAGPQQRRRAVAGADRARRRPEVRGDRKLRDAAAGRQARQGAVEPRGARPERKYLHSTE